MKDTKWAARLTAAAIVFVSAAGTSSAWGPRTQEAIVTTAARVLSEQENIALVRLERDIRRGATASEQEVEALIPGAYSDLRGAIESEMYALQAVHGERIDPYMAYRLGVLGKLVAQYTAPLADADPTYRNLYYADVDKNISNTRLSSSPRRPVDNDLYLGTARQQAQARTDLILRDYREGVGFGGVARGSLSQEASRSVDAVADVWYTILSGQSAVGGVSNRQMLDFNLNALRFYLDRKNPEETRRAYDRLMAGGDVPADLRARVGDLYFEAGQFEQAMKEYRSAIEQDPSRKDIVQRVAEYYNERAGEALSKENFEGAVEAYRQAQAVDPANVEAQTKRTEAEARITQRENRLQQAQQAIAEAQNLQQQADQFQQQGQYGEAMELLQRARQNYASVPKEFESESLAAQRGLTDVEIRTRELKGLLVKNTDQLSGSAFGVEARRLAESSATGLHKEAFETLIDEGYTDKIDELKRELRDSLIGPAPAP